MEINSSLIPQYDVLPHGTRSYDGKLYMVFKMIVHIEQLKQGAEEEIIVTKEGNWEKLREKVNGGVWRYNLYKTLAGDNPEAKLTLHFGNETGKLVKFIRRADPYIQGDYKDLPNFCLGTRTRKSKEINSFDFLSTKDSIFKIVKLQKKELNRLPLRQFETTKVGTPTADRSSLDNGDDKKITYTNILRWANDYAKTTPLDISPLKADKLANGSETYNFRTIYASILDEPEAAEHHFGVMREFWIEESEFSDIAADFKYTIIVNDIEEQHISNFKFLKAKVSDNKIKYYNGPATLTFGNDSFDDDSVTYELTDPYKNELEQEEKHPDGLYVKVKYKTTDNKLDDPFDNGYVKGITPLIRIVGTDLNTACYSITRMKRKLHFQNGGILETENEGGHLNPNAQLETTEGPFRNNVLLAWRGDNLALNRVPRTLLEDESDQQAERGAVKVKSPDCREEIFMRKHLLKKEETLEDSSQIPFRLDTKYRVYIRPVTPTHFFLRSVHEQLKEHEDELTVEDFITLNDAKNPYMPLEPQLEYSSIDGVIPVKSPTMIGAKTYKNSDSDFVDKQAHLVLNRIKGESHDTRYLYPPHIKFEDFKMLNYLSVERLTMEEDNGWPDIEDYVKRCMRLEDRLGNKIPKSAWHRRKIDYLADPRAKDLVLIPSDLFTASLFPIVTVAAAFAIDTRFPYYDDVKSVIIRVQSKTGQSRIQDDAQSSLIVESAAGKTVIARYLRDGIYNFNVYVSDGDHSLEGRKKCSPLPIRISIVNRPDPRTIKKNDLKNLIALRNPGREGNGINPNLWFQKITFPDDRNTWKSAKYQERTEVLRIQNEGAEQLLKMYNRVNANKAQALLANEYPYEVFLVNEGSLDGKSGLRTTLFPESISIHGSYNITSGTFFSMMINDKETLEVSREDSQYVLKIGNEKKPTSTLDLKVVFFPSKNAYIVQVNGNDWLSLDHYINPDISINDINMPDAVLKQIQFSGELADLKFTRANSYYFIADLNHPYSSKKTVQLFGSSIFQAYFPNATSEFEMGVNGSWFDIHIPNNSPPTPPVMEAEVLLMHRINRKWNDSRGKKKSMESLIKLTLTEDFMTEGKNKLGIVVRKNVGNSSAKDDFTSKIGEDITKLKKPIWIDYDLTSLINFGLEGFGPVEKQLLSKYMPVKQTVAYKIGATIYHVLEFEPFYNTKLRKWQIVLPLLDFRRSETMFLKLFSIKISPGNNLYKNESEDYYEDLTGTSLSSFSDPVTFPVNNRKAVFVKRDPHSYTITFEPGERKAYYVLLTDKKPDLNLLNFTNEFKDPQFKSFLDFNLISQTLENGSEQSMKSTGKLLRCKGLKSVTISRQDMYSIVVLEFEIHKNTRRNLIDNGPFVTKNPLFEEKGLRLISVSEFKK